MKSPPADDRGPSTVGGQMPALGFVGAGRLGSGLAVAAEAAGFRVAAVASRSGGSATELAARLPAAAAGSATFVVERAQAVFLAVPDACIRDVCAALPWREGQIVVHASALDGLELLDAARAAGAQRGSFHPLVAFGEPDGTADALRGASVALDGDPARSSS